MSHRFEPAIAVARPRAGADQGRDHRHLARANAGEFEGEHFQPRCRGVREQDAKERITERRNPEEARSVRDPSFEHPAKKGARNEPVVQTARWRHRSGWLRSPRPRW